jgi:vacuolar-type H+-ATPase subunit I/STV1
MGVPKQVERDLLQLEEYERSLEAPAAPATVETPTKPVEPQPTEPAEPKLTAVKEPKAEPTPLEVWEQKYRTLEGKYQAEVPRLHAQVREMTQSIKDLTEKLSKAPQQPELKPAPQEPLVSAKDVESFGEELIDVQRRVAREVMREYVDPLKSELSKRDERIAELEKTLTKTGGDVATLTFEQRLAMQVPDFEAINTDPKWIAWLDEIDPYTNEPRRVFAEFVYSNGDVAKLKNIVDFYKKTTVPAAAAAPTADDVKRQKQAELERQVAPPRTSTPSAPSQPQNTRIYTEAEMNSLFGKVRQMNIAGKYEEAAKLEAELSEAYMQGRVRG